MNTLSMSGEVSEQQRTSKEQCQLYSITTDCLVAVIVAAETLGIPGQPYIPNIDPKP